jgi:hypothetical protein
LKNFDLGKILYKPENLQNAAQGVGNPLLDSGNSFPDPSNIFTVSAPQSECVWMNFKHSVKVFSPTTVSGFNKRINSPFAAAIPRLFAFEKPRLFFKSMS